MEFCERVEQLLQNPTMPDPGFSALSLLAGPPLQGYTWAASTRLPSQQSSLPMNPQSNLTHLLAFDTATEFMNVVLKTPQGQWVTEEAGGARASARLIPAIKDLMREAGCAWKNLDAIAFGRGPGAFTGIRTACSVAQGLAFGADKPVLALDTLMAVAQNALFILSTTGAALETPTCVWVAMDARMDEIYAGHYRCEAGRWQTLVEPHLTSPEALNDRWMADAPAIVAGSALVAFERLQLGPTTLRVPQALPRADALVPLAHQTWALGELVDASQALPLYVREKVAQTTAERAAAKASAPLGSV